MKRQRQATQIIWGVTAVILLVLLVLPIAVYVHTFDGPLSKVHARWGEMGSAMSGIYGPIISLLGFGVLIMQVQLQRQTNRHMFEQAYVQDARADLEFYVTQLSVVLNSAWGENSTVRDELQAYFMRVSLEDLRGSWCINKASHINDWKPELFSIWIAICPILEGLRTYKGTSYELHFNSAIQKIVAMATFDTAVSLDNFVWSKSEGRLGRWYQFSPNFRDS